MIPKYLYHYTSIEALSGIIENNYIKFTRLDLLNDPVEGIVSINNKEIPFISKNIYCSCWTADEYENLSMWSIYADKGVRIKLQANMFSDFYNLKECDCGFLPVGKITPINLQGHSNSCTGEPISVETVYGPIKIQYMENVQKTYENVIKTSAESSIKIPNNFYDIDILNLGNKKARYWKYENEWRFKISPFAHCNASTEFFSKCSDINFNVDKNINVQLVKPIIEIMLAPKATDTEYNQIKKILIENNKEITLVKSKIKIRK